MTGILDALFDELAGTAVGIPPGTLTALKVGTSLAAKPETGSTQNDQAERGEVYFVTSYEAELTTRILRDYNPSEYKFKWKCGSCESWPNAEGPNHDTDCSRFRPVFTLHSKAAHKHECRFCGAVPYVPGTHHLRDCRRREKELINLDPRGFNYKSTCTHCGVKPKSQGPHHRSGCQRNWDYTAYSTKIAHTKCRYCTAKPFPAGPHHRMHCRRYLPYSTL